MKAIVVREYGDENVLKLEEVPEPVPTAGQILVDIKVAGVNPVDTYVRAGNHPTAPPLPFTPGKDAAGVIAAVGDGVTKVAVGDRVYLAGAVSGTYAEKALCTETQVWKLPEEATFEQGAGIFVPYATAYRALFKKAKIRPGEKILIHGASGAVGIAAIQWAKNAGAVVFGTAGSTKGWELVERIGADKVFDHTDPENYLTEILDATGGVGVDVILEMLANENLSKDFYVLAKFGRIVVIGSRGLLEFDPR
ncbi:MAG: NADPH:quinone reductase, partial [Acidobacteriota bacterium]|nr:NADPH:quinone reductase [Acidobacteriota bacterium]